MLYNSAIPSGYTERQKVMAVRVEGHFVDVFLTPQAVGGNENFYRVVHSRTLGEYIPTCALKHYSRRQGLFSSLYEPS